MNSFGQVPGNVLETAKRVALQGGPSAVFQFMASQGFPKNGNWCGEFAASVVKAAGGAPPNAAAVASNWRGIGAPTNAPQPGDIAIRRFDRRGNPVATGDTGSHVTFVQSIDPQTGQFIGLGGNQGNFQSKYPLAGYEFRRLAMAPTPNKADPFGVGNTYDGSAFGPLTPGARAPELPPGVNVQSPPPGLLSPMQLAGGNPTDANPFYTGPASSSFGSNNSQWG